MKVLGFNHLSVGAKNLEESARFYQAVLGMELIPTYNFGFGFKVFLTDYASLQLDLRDHIFTLDLLGKSNSTQNLELTTGLSFYF